MAFVPDVFIPTIDKRKAYEQMKKTLYIATFDVGYTHILRVFYAANEAEKEQKKSDLEKEINATCKSLEHYPNGFRLVMSTLPGTVEVTEEVQPRTIEV